MCDLVASEKSEKCWQVGRQEKGTTLFEVPE